MELNERVISWKKLKSLLELVRDKDLRNAMLAEFRKRAIRDWGYNPDTAFVKSQEIELDDWEKELVEDIKKAETYETDTRVEKRKQTEKEALARMKNFIETGGTYYDLPVELQNKHTAKLYMCALDQWLDENIKIIEKNA